MRVTNFSDLRKNLARTMDQVAIDHTPIVITRDSKAPVVMMSLEDFNGWEETLYLSRSPENYKRLLEGVMDVKKGNYKARKLIKTEE